MMRAPCWQHDSYHAECSSCRELNGIPLAVPKVYVYRWDRQGRKGQHCRVLARGTMNSCLVRFADGFEMVTSRNALRRAEVARA